MAELDLLTALEKWAEQGKAPNHLVVTDKFGVPGRTRPLCQFPEWPKYKGHGNLNSSQNFKCEKDGEQDDDGGNGHHDD